MDTRDNYRQLQLSTIGNCIFSLFKFGYFIQESVAKIFFKSFISPLLFIGKLLDEEKKFPIEERSKNDNYILLDFERITHYRFYKLLRFLLSISKRLGGTLHSFDLYEHILNWNQNVPLIGFEESKTTYTIETLFKKKNQVSKNRSVDITWLTNHKKCGVFKIISKEVINNEVIVGAVWINGKNKGQFFNFTPYGPKSSDLESYIATPSVIYHPPKFFIYVIEFLASASAILAFIQLTREGFKIFLAIINEYI